MSAPTVTRASTPELTTGPSRSWIARVRTALIALLTVLIASLVLLSIGGANPFLTLAALVTGATGDKASIGESLIRIAPILIIALGLVPSLKVGLFNIGAPGQIGVGGLLCTIGMLHMTQFPGWLSLTVGIMLAAIGGAACAIIPAVMRAKLGINEVITTLVFNFLVVYLLTYLLNGPLRAARANIPQSAPLPKHEWLPILITGTRAHVGLVLALIAVAILAVWARSPSGYRLRLLGASRPLARQAGVVEGAVIIRVMLIAGAAAGIAGWMQVTGVDHRLMATVADPIGYAGLFAALLGGLGAIGILFSSVFLGGLLQGGNSLQIGAGISPEIAQALLGVILLTVALRQPSKTSRDHGGS